MKMRSAATDGNQMYWLWFVSICYSHFADIRHSHWPKINQDESDVDLLSTKVTGLYISDDLLI